MASIAGLRYIFKRPPASGLVHLQLSRCVCDLSAVRDASAITHPGALDEPTSIPAIANGDVVSVRPGPVCCSSTWPGSTCGS